MRPIRGKPFGLSHFLDRPLQVNMRESIAKSAAGDAMCSYRVGEGHALASPDVFPGTFSALGRRSL